ncbi:MAG: membrane dipeptidase [Pseudomonadota bacterium]|nr:MAG: dipeptidase [Pseudomonadota bacterium]
MTFESSTARRGASSSLRGGFRRAALVGSGLALATLLVRLPARGAEPKERPIAVVDLHVDLPYRHNYRDGSFAESSGQFPARKLARAGVVGVVLPLFVPKSHAPEGPRFSDFETSYKGVLAEIRKTPPYLPPGCVETPGRVRTFLAFEGAGAFAEDPKRLDEWVGRGVRSLGLVHTKANALASSSGDAKPMPFGLTRAGKALVERAHRLRVPIDVSHASDRAVEDVIELSRRSGVPTIATHSNARALADHPRNLTDEQIRAIASTGGVIGVNFHSRFLASGRRATLADVVAHVLHLVKVAGVQHVAIGSDFEGDINPPAELADVGGFPRLASALERAGLSRDDVRRIFSRNALRILCGEK